MVPRKYVFSGEFKENKRHGYGVIKFLNKEKDTIYEGQWASGLKEGTGRQVEPDDSQYIGSWSHGKRHGYGTLKISEYEHYAGEFYQGVKHKNGTEVFKKGDMYVGQYASGKFHGKGTFLIIQESIPGPITPGTKEILSKGLDKATVAGQPTTWNQKLTNMMAITKMTKRMVLESISGKTGPHMRGTSFMI